MDLWIAIGFIVAVSGLAFIAGRRLSLSVYRDRPLLFAECLIFSLVFAFGWFGRLQWASALPVSAALCWSNWMPVFLAFTAGLACEVRAVRAVWRSAVSGVLMIIGIGFLVLPVIRPVLAPIQISEIALWKDGVCLQSNEASCGPAAAATLLRQAGVIAPPRHFEALASPSPISKRQMAASSEAAMARVCLTSEKGTSPLGLFRGLQITLAGTGRDARVASSEPSLWQSLGQLPNVAVIRFHNDQSAGPVQRLLGTSGEGHAVVVHSRTADGKWKVADPAVGWLTWDDQEFRRLFSGDAIYLSPRRP
ncbi:hypothetical protein FYK55_10870 [Roseiconus nitratireducens]|uniref:Peptidase C39 domain-containing protein n=1 Tax=Roseiconus nitratireducens TaxID=2605748 RepID=A0A5M6D834_9BACT|nr:hypothetical protein [Roseiconus nitratireducens]KAA5543691.1 hypothetical protein FYK55_10870 [Roseiconus nitratireducens]